MSSERKQERKTQHAIVRESFPLPAVDCEGERTGPLSALFPLTGPTLNESDEVETSERHWEVRNTRNEGRFSQAEPEGGGRPAGKCVHLAQRYIHHRWSESADLRRREMMAILPEAVPAPPGLQMTFKGLRSAFYSSAAIFVLVHLMEHIH